MSRKTYIYRPHPETGEMTAIEVSRDAPDADVQLGIQRKTGDGGKFEYDNLRAPDGTDISSREKRRDWMKAADMVDPRDFRESLPKAKQERENFLRGDWSRPQFEDLKRDIYQAGQQVRGRRKR
jgi:hypothetical protein